MSTTRPNGLRRSLKVATLLALLAATCAADFRPATVSARAATPATLAKASPCASSSDWEPAPDMITWRVHAAAVAAGGHVYVLGGYIFRTTLPLADVESASIGADGRLGAWITTTALITPELGAAAVAVNGFIYVVGGYENSWQNQDMGSVQRAAILANGQLGAWEPQTALGQYGRESLAAVATSTHIYVLGGWNTDGAAISTDVRQTAIQPDGSLGPWVAATPLPIGRHAGGAVIAGDFIYVVGGVDLGDPQHSVARAEINADGSLGAWEDLPPLQHARYDLSALVSDGYLYAAGGTIVAPLQNDTTATTVERAAIRADGSLGSWAYVDPLLTPRAAYAAASSNGHFYLMGGHKNNGVMGMGPVNTVEQVAASALTLPSESWLTINDRALFTNQTAVSLTISGQPGTAQMQVSNDGSFAGAAWQDCLSPLAWSITQYGLSTLPRVVYVRFKSAGGDISDTYFDDIILDMVPPTGTMQLAPMIPAASSPASTNDLPYKLYLPLALRSFCAPASCPPNVMLHLSASDDTSGVASMQIANEPAFTGRLWEPYGSSKPWYLPAGLTTVYARFRDRAGNVSTTVAASLGP